MSADRESWWQPGKLRSLWDMLEVNGSFFVAAIDGLRDAQGLIEEDPAYLKPENLTTWFDMLGGELKKLGCRQADKKLANIRFLFKQAHPHQANFSPKVIASNFNKNMNEVWSRLKDELEDQKLYCVSGRDAEYLGPVAEIYGEAVAATFNDQLYDLEEAAKSIAFGRGTASVFHLMRAMEAAVHRLGTKLSVTVDNKHGSALPWGKIIANIKVPVEAMPEGDERDQWSEIQSLLYHVKQAWRNNTMHPKQTYTLEEAEDVFSAVKTFLRRLAPMV